MATNGFHEYDVVVIGAGIAGTVLTYLLNKKSINVRLIGAIKNPPIKLGESLPPSALPMFDRLGLSAFLNSHQTSSGYQAVWGSRKIKQSGFGGIRSRENRDQPMGWKIDKTILTEQIRETLPDATLLQANVTSIDASHTGHIIHIDDEQEWIRAKFIVIATGRQSGLSRQLGIKHHTFDQLLAYTVNVPRIKQDAITKPVFIEAFEHGWGLASQLDVNQNVLSVFTNKYSDMAREYKRFNNWRLICQHTEYFKHFIPDNVSCQVLGLNASSRIAKNLQGKSWLLIGDAAMSFDPLSSHGMTTAIYTAEQAANALCQQLAAPGEHFKQYAQKMTSIYNTYLNELVSLYRQERRWSGSGFWESKRSVAEEGVVRVVGL